MLLHLHLINQLLSRDRLTSIFLLLCALAPALGIGEDDLAHRSQRYYTAFINITYLDPTGAVHISSKEAGQYGETSRIGPESGTLVHVQHRVGAATSRNGCDVHQGPVPGQRWIALVRRGGCDFKVKIANAAHKLNASAVVIYNNQSNEMLTMSDEVSDVVSVFVSLEYGESLARLVNNGTLVNVAIRVGQARSTVFNNISKTSVLFVSISFIVLMIISLAWLVFYYIQRFRYAHAKERLSRRLANAAKKALTKIPQRTLKNGDKELLADFDQCAICIEGYKAHDVVRILPCKHVFHKSCVDPWLLEQRSCPMCKLDILKAYGFLNMNGSQDSVTNAESVTHGELELTVRSSPLQDSSSDHEDREESDSLGLHHVQVLHLHPPDVETHDMERSARRLNNLGVSVVLDQGVEAIESDRQEERQSLMSGHSGGSTHA